MVKGVTLATLVMMPQSTRILTTACPKPAVPLETVKGSMAESLTLPLHKDPGTQSRRHSHPPVWCRDLGSLLKADQATSAVSPTLLGLHPLHQMARPHVEQRSPQESQPAQQRVHLASGAAVLGWPHHKDGRHTYAESSLLQ